MFGVGGSGTTISMSDGFGKSNQVVSLAGLPDVQALAATGTVTARIWFLSDGLVQRTINSITTTLTTYKWFTPTTTGIGANYWIRVTETLAQGLSSTNLGDTRGVWLQLTAGRNFGISRTTSGPSIKVYTVEISTDSAGSNIIATKTGWTLDIERD